MPRLVVLSRAGCTLCDELVEELAVLTAPRGLSFEILDVDADPEHRRRWGLKVPVLLCDGSPVCHGRLDAAALLRLLDR